MAKQGKKMPKKYRQAKAAAKPAAKAAFPGKTKAGRRDPMTKYSAEDRELFKELKEESKKGYLTTDKGEKVFVKPDETAKERIARERKEALRKFREEADMDEGKAKSRAERMKAQREEIMKKNAAAKAESKGKRAPGLLQSASEPKKQTTKLPAKKAAKPTALGARRLEQLKKAGISESNAKKILATNKPAYGELTPRQENALQRKVAKEDKRMAKLRAADPAKFDARERVAKSTKLTSSEKAKVIEKIGKTEKPKPAAPAKAGKYLDMQKAKNAKVYSITNVQPEKAAKGTVKPKFVQKKTAAKKSVEKASTSKAVAIRPKGAVATTAKKAATTAAKKGGAAAVLKGAGRVAGKVIGGRVGMALTAAALAKPVLKALVQTPADKKKEQAAKGKTPGPEARSNQPRITGQGRFVGAGGATTKVGSSYTVKKGDTLSGIAKNAGVSLADIRKANPKLMTEKKYKQGSAIWSGTKVRIPKK